MPHNRFHNARLGKIQRDDWQAEFVDVLTGSKADNAFLRDRKDNNGDASV